MALVGFGLGLGLGLGCERRRPVAPRGRRRVLISPKATVLRNFKVTKRPPLIVTPERPTPSHSHYLTNIDNQLILRTHVNILLFYPSSSDSDSPSMKNQEDPVHIIEEALAKLLVYYYPFAGRLRYADDKGKLLLDCTGEGVPFVEADADISLEDFGVLAPPFPRALDFMSSVPGPDTDIDSPLLRFQVTRLQCGGFILNLSFKHCVTDGVGITQFVKALGEIARGASSPTVPPVWNREILRPRQKREVNYPGVGEYFKLEEKYLESLVQAPAVPQEMKAKSFYFGSKEIAALKRQIEAEGVKHCTPFEVISACLWRSRTKALRIPAHQHSTILFPFNARSRLRPPIPRGYYGNLIVFAYATTKSEYLTERSLSFAAKLINEGKRMVKEEYVRSFIDLAELNAFPNNHGCPSNTCHGYYLISDVSKILLDLAEADFGWGKAAYACPVYPPWLHVSYLIRPSVNAHEGFLASVSLPSIAMEIFEQDISNAINDCLKA